MENIFSEIFKTWLQFISIQWIFFIIIILAIGFILISYFYPEQQKQKYQYKLKDSVMTSSELTFFKVLLLSVGNQYNIFPQIHLDAILDHKVIGQSWFGAFRHINEKSVDFVLCDKDNGKPIFAIELDDPSHEREDRKERDIEVERILKDVSFPLLRIKDKSNFTSEEISKMVFEILNNNLTNK